MPELQRSPNPEWFAKQVLAVPGMAPFADKQLKMYGETGTVHEGLVRCAHHLMTLTPVEVADMVLQKLQDQGTLPEATFPSTR